MARFVSHNVRGRFADLCQWDDGRSMGVACMNSDDHAPMPWFALNIMQEEDLKGIYQFIRYRGAGGEPAPASVPLAQ
jgi:hypothetical protein